MTEIGRAYGGALYALAQEEHLEEPLLRQLDGVVALLGENPGYVRLIDNRGLPRSERVALLDEAFGGRVEPYLLNFMKILCERGAFSHMTHCRDAFVQAYHEAHGIVPATAVCASMPDEQQIARLKEALERKTGKHVELTVRVDASLRGGMRVEMAGRRYDNTIASRLTRLRRAMAGRTTVE